MVVLRSREIDHSQSIPKPLSEPDPLNPAPNEPSVQLASPSLITLNLLDRLGSDSASNRRRSLRLASKLGTTDDDCVLIGSSKRKRERNSDSTVKGKEIDSVVNLNSSYGKNIVRIDLECSDADDDKSVFVEEQVECDGEQFVNGNSSSSKRKREINSDSNGKGKEIDSVVRIDLECNDDDRSVFVEEEVECRSDKLVIVEGKLECDGEQVVNGSSSSSKRKRGDSERNSDSNVKGKEIDSVVNGDSSSGKKIVKIDLEFSDDDKSVFVEEEVECDGEQVENLTFNGSNIAESSGSGRYSRDDKGKEKLVFDDSKPDIEGMTKLELESQLDNLRSKIKDLVDSFKDTMEGGNQANNSSSSSTRMDRFREIAKKNASRFAYFEPQEQNLAPHVDVEMPSEEEIENVEDWPGPFSTAMKIIRDREKKLNSQLGQFTSKEAKSVPIKWIPSKPQGCNLSRAYVPSLIDLCMKILVKNVDAVTSLDHVPDALRHRLCRLLSDSRGMNSCFLELIVRGSPTEIRIKDCSWLTEEEFTKCFGACDTSNLSVLQLDQCGRCIADYLLPATLARSPRSMPSLITLSLSGACRLTDIGLSSLLSAAPALRSINLSQCSLLSSVGIGSLAQSLGSQLLELYIDDCQSLDIKLLLPALKKLEHLEVLSLAGIQAVYDGFVREFVSACGHNIKELVLADCTNLTDSSIKVIAETCPGILALDLVNLVKLTDATLGYLANSCQRIQSLKFCRNNFSDEAIAAFLETSGEPLKELSLNNVAQVGNNTALALARRSRSLEKLDLSWCRNLTDEAVGLIVDSCSSLKVLKLFGCGQITDMFLNGHSNEGIE